MKRATFNRFSVVVSLSALVVLLTLVAGCSHNIIRFGTGGRYEEAKQELSNRKQGNVDKAIAALQYVVSKDPLYENSLTLLGWAYYKRQRYQDAFQMTRRALAVNKEDEIAWLVLAVTQLRLGDDQAGLESAKYGITLLSKVSTAGYRGYQSWDREALVRNGIRRSIAVISTKGLEEKKQLIGILELTLDRVAEEEWAQVNEKTAQRTFYEN